MSSNISRRRFRFAAAALGAASALAFASAAGAQSRIAIDGSLGGEARTIAPNGQELFIPSADGRRRGEALFHSFSAFDLRAGDRAVFGTPAETTRIISRVTGSEGALIDGTVRIDRFGGVDFWMISPNGLVVGPNANIDTDGAVHLSTGDELRFSDGAIFSADPSTALTLTSAPPSAFGFNQAPARLEVRGDGLEVVIDDVTLAGGSVEIRDARIGSSFGGQVLIAGAAAGDVVAVERRTVDALSTGPATLDGEVRIVGDPTAPEEARTRVGFGGSGVVALEGRRVRIDGAEVGVDMSDTSDASSPGDGVSIVGRRIEIVSDGAVRTFTTGAGDAGDIAVTGFRTLLIDRGDRVGSFTGETAIESESRGAGAAGDVIVSGDRVVVRNRGRIASNTLSSGAAGDVEVSVVSVRLASGGQIGSGVLDPDDGDPATGVGGAVRIRAADLVSVRGVAAAPAPPGETRPDEPSGVFTSTEASEGGAAGVVSVRTPTLILAAGGEIASETRNGADAGRIAIRADDVSLSGSAEITTNVVDPRAPGGGDPTGERRLLGNAGDIRLRPLSDGAVATLTLGSGAAIASDGSVGLSSEAGSVVLRGDVVEIDGGARVSTDASTDTGGDLTIVARDFARIGGAVTTSVEDGPGDGGQVRIAGDLVLAPSGAVVQANAGDIGDGGRVTIETDVFLRDFAGTIVEARGSGGAPGSILILGDTGAETGEAADLDGAFLDAFALVDDFCVAAVTGGSSLVLTPLAPGSEAPAPALFGAAVPFPGGEGAGVESRIGGFLDFRPCERG